MLKPTVLRGCLRACAYVGQTLHSQSLNSPSGPPPELSQTVDDTRQLSTSIKSRIKTVNTLTSGDKGKKAQVKGVKEQFMGLLQEYQSVEKMHRSKVKQRAERQFKIGTFLPPGYPPLPPGT